MEVVVVVVVVVSPSWFSYDWNHTRGFLHGWQTWNYWVQRGIHAPVRVLYREVHVSVNLIKLGVNKRRGDFQDALPSPQTFCKEVPSRKKNDLSSLLMFFFVIFVGDFFSNFSSPTWVSQHPSIRNPGVSLRMESGRPLSRAEEEAGWDWQNHSWGWKGSPTEWVPRWFMGLIYTVDGSEIRRSPVNCW